MMQQMILEEYSKVQKDLIVNWLGTNQKRFDKVVIFFY